MSTDGEGSGHASRCPRCGLALQVVMRPDGPEASYDFPSWDRLCRFPVLGGPSMCLAFTFEPAAAAEPGADPLDDTPGKTLGYS